MKAKGVAFLAISATLGIFALGADISVREVPQATVSIPTQTTSTSATRKSTTTTTQVTEKIFVTETESADESEIRQMAVFPEKRCLEVEPVIQYPELPTGCEVTALTTVLRYYGFDIDKEELFDEYMPHEGALAETFDRAFIGDPRYSWGYGCFAPVVAETANSYFACNAPEMAAVDISGTDFCDLFAYIDSGEPVIVWVSMGMTDIQWEYRWTTADGRDAYFPSGEHCLVLNGYDLDSGIVYTADPMNGSMTYSLERFRSVYEQMKKQAVMISRT